MSSPKKGGGSGSGSSSSARSGSVGGGDEVSEVPTVSVAVAVLGNGGQSMPNHGHHGGVGYHHHNYHHHNQQHNYYNNGYNNNNRYNNNKLNYYHHNNGNNNNNHTNNGSYHQYNNNNNRRYYNYNNTYNNYNGYNNNQYYNHNNFYNHHTHHHSYNSNNNHLPPPSIVAVAAAAAAAAALSPNASPSQSASASAPASAPSNVAAATPTTKTPTIPIPMNASSNFQDYWPSGHDDGAELGSGLELPIETPPGPGNSSSFFSFVPKRNYNGHVTDGGYDAKCYGRSNSPTTVYSSSNLTPYQHKLRDIKLDLEHDFKQAGKFYMDGFPHLGCWTIKPDELVKSFKFGEVIERPIMLAAESSDWAELSEAIWEKFLANQQTTETFRKKMELWSDMAERLKKQFLHYGLQIVGSTMSGFGSNSSDVDMCLLVRRVEIDQQSEAVDLLHQLWAVLGAPSYFDKIDMVYAKVPLLKCRDSVRNLEVDLNCNNYVGIRNTHLLYCYAQQDWRLKPLVLIVKLWAKYHDINDAKNMTISSYSLVLMVIHFLQFGVVPAILPCLHKLYPEKFVFHQDIIQIKRFMSESIPIEENKNSQALGELLIKFFEYYAIKFDYKASAISVRSGGVTSIRLCQLNKAPKNDAHQWKQLCIEEPFDYTNTARSVYDRDAFDRIRGIFFASWQRMYLSHDLESIFTPISAFEARQIGVRIRS